MKTLIIEDVGAGNNIHHWGISFDKTYIGAQRDVRTTVAENKAKTVIANFWRKKRKEMCKYLLTGSY